QKRQIQEILMRKSILDPYIDPKSFSTHDDYSIGVLLWEISSGRCSEVERARFLLQKSI
ncbi:15131_t:CDS:1, partial [Funneliformis mosseae]